MCRYGDFSGSARQLVSMPTITITEDLSDSDVDYSDDEARFLSYMQGIDDQNSDLVDASSQAKG